MTRHGGEREFVPKLTEKQFMGQIKELATILGWLWYHPFDSRKSTPGFPDLVLARAPRVIFAELKVEAGFLTPAQKLWQRELVECRRRVEYYLWMPRDWPQIEQALARPEPRPKEEAYVVRDLL